LLDALVWLDAQGRPRPTRACWTGRPGPGHGRLARRGTRPDARSADPEAQWEQVGRPLVDILREQLVALAYQDIRLGSEIIGVRNRRNVPLYYLVFASKTPLGHRFGQAISRYDASGQASLL
jgi:hypothetical protein